MKIILQKLIALVLFTALFQVSVQADPVHIVAHRGFWKSEAARGAQNSKASFREAMNHNLWGSEFDVKLTKDLVPVVFHDRVINGKSIAGSTYAELKNEVLPNGEKLPTLDEFLSSIPKDTFTRLVFELKAPIPFTTELADILIDKSVASLRKFGLLAPEKTLFIAGSAYICKQVAAKLPGFTVQSLAKDRTPEEVFADGVNGIDFEQKIFLEHSDYVKRAHDLGMSVNVWTVNDPEMIGKMIDLGVDQITTNEPLLVKEILEKRGEYFTEASDLNLIGKLCPDTPNPYNRVDSLVYGGFTKSELKRALMASGIAVAFKTDSKRISVKTEYYERGDNVKFSTLEYSGYDLYIKKDGKWLWAGAGVSPNDKPEDPAEIIKAMDGTMHECLIYLPLYSILKSVKIGVDGGSEIASIPDPFRYRIGMFGSSFTHGAGASRPGLAYPAVFTRDTGLQMLSLGVSGQSKLQQSFARVIAGADIDALVLDAFSNPSVEIIEKDLFPFIETIQAAHPDIPIIFQRTIYREWRNFNTRFINFEEERIERSVALVKEAQKRYKNIYLIYPDATSPDHETTADGTHPNAYGYLLWAHSIEKPILKILKKYGIK